MTSDLDLRADHPHGDPIGRFGPELSRPELQPRAARPWPLSLLGPGGPVPEALLPEDTAPEDDTSNLTHGNCPAPSAGSGPCSPSTQPRPSHSSFPRLRPGPLRKPHQGPSGASAPLPGTPCPQEPGPSPHRAPVSWASLPRTHWRPGPSSGADSILACQCPELQPLRGQAPLSRALCSRIVFLPPACCPPGPLHAPKPALSLLRPGCPQSSCPHTGLKTWPPGPPPQGLTLQTAGTSWQWLDFGRGGNCSCGGCLSRHGALPCVSCLVGGPGWGCVAEQSPVPRTAGGAGHGSLRLGAMAVTLIWEWRQGGAGLQPLPLPHPGPLPCRRLDSGPAGAAAPRGPRRGPEEPEDKAEPKIPPSSPSQVPGTESHRPWRDSRPPGL